MQSNNRLRNIEIPENLFSNLGEIKKNKAIAEDDQTNDNGIKLTNYSKHKEYRKRISEMYDNFENLNPIDNKIDNILYFNNYIEKGIVVKPKVSSLKQFWTEYRLITNEKKLPKYHLNQDKKAKNENIENDNYTKLIEEEKTEKKKNDNIEHEKDNIDEKLTNFDKLFTALSERVKEINSYIDELKEIRINIDESNDKLEKDKEKFKEEKKEFQNYKQEEEKKIEKEKKNLKVNYDRLQTIIDDLDKKLNEIEK